ncbi:MAG: NAD(P)-binding domain-containing protein [Proteobacteria bacterium]|nr:NAD(P)-binding domain-containing protein [Pseudomonadota bacterium]
MRIAVIGAGPIGIEAALAAQNAGHTVDVFERGAVGQALLDWGHVRLFTPWKMNTTELGRQLCTLTELEACPTGADMVEHYLKPIAATLNVHEGHRLHGVTRSSLRKTEAIGGGTRGPLPFRLLFDCADGERVVTVDAVLDCSGVVGQPNPVGIGGVVAKGERAAAAEGRILYGIHHATSVPGERVAVLGSGATGCTLVLELLAEGRQVTWLCGTETPSFHSPADDALAERHGLWVAAREAVAKTEHLPGARVESVSHDNEDLVINLEDGRTVQVDTLVACTGFRPDLAPTRELQVHLCYASEGPMKLAAALLAASGSGGDCLDQVSQGAEVLRNPEPRFFVLGAKSYGRRNDFLLQIGHAQVSDAITMLD